MTRDEVLSAAGEPHEADLHGWYYNVWNGFVLYSDMLHVGFDEHDCVASVSF